MACSQAVPWPGPCPAYPSSGGDLEGMLIKFPGDVNLRRRAHRESYLVLGG